MLDPRFLVTLFEDTGRSFVVVSANVKYKIGARHGDMLEIRTRTCATSSYRLKFFTKRVSNRRGRGGYTSRRGYRGDGMCR